MIRGRLCSPADRRGDLWCRGAGFTKSDWDRFLLEVAEAYGAGWVDRNKCWGVVAAVGGFAWGKTPEETEHYCGLVRVERVPV